VQVAPGYTPPTWREVIDLAIACGAITKGDFEGWLK
jgi:hypothetical protein